MIYKKESFLKYNNKIKKIEKLKKKKKTWYNENDLGLCNLMKDDSLKGLRGEVIM